MPKKRADTAPDPNRLVRVAAGRYRSEDERFEVREGGTGWFVTDAQQANEFGQELVTGPFATLAAVREALPEARRTTLRPLPRPKATRERRGPRRRKPAARPEPAPEHRLVRMLRDAARDRFPPADLAVEILERPPGPSDAVVAFSGHNVVAAGLDADEVRAHLPDDDPGGPLSAPFLTWLGLQLETPPGSLDVVLVADGTGRPDDDHPLTEVDETETAFADRIARARRYRTEVRLFADADGRGVVILGRGLAERREVSIEVHPKRRGRGVGVALARAALGLLSESEPLYAQVAPGNVASLRAFLRAGYRPIGAEVLFLRRPG
jgi:GNAT superfamily N-acetyltransferase